jgi:hypothetical protein
MIEWLRRFCKDVYLNNILTKNTSPGPSPKGDLGPLTCSKTYLQLC